MARTSSLRALDQHIQVRDSSNTFMAYDSPIQIRRRQQAAERRATEKRAKRPHAIRILSGAEWDATCDFHVSQIHAKSNYPDSVAAHARALVHMAIERRTAEIQRDLGRARWKAVLIARHELLNTEVS